MRGNTIPIGLGPILLKVPSLDITLKCGSCNGPVNIGHAALAYSHLTGDTPSAALELLLEPCQICMAGAQE